MPKISPQSKSFIILFSLIIISSYLCLTMWLLLLSTPHSASVYGSNYRVISYGNFSAAPAAVPSAKPQPPVNVSGWPVYTNSEYGFSFQYKPGWKVLPAVQSKGFTVLQVDPGIRYYNIKIYISPAQFYAMDDLPATSETIDGQTASNVSNALYGIKANGLYYTFDVGWSMSLVPDFDGLVHSVKFN